MADDSGRQRMFLLQKHDKSGQEKFSEEKFSALNRIAALCAADVVTP